MAEQGLNAARIDAGSDREGVANEWRSTLANHRELAVDHVFRFAERCQYSGVIGDAHSDDPMR
jgi:hypothetical protein